ncbi:MAG: chemotaxis protein CheX [Opitutales bacterium]
MPPATAPTTLIEDRFLKGLLAKSIGHVLESNVGRKSSIAAHLDADSLALAQNSLGERLYSCFILFDRAYPGTMCLQMPHTLARIVACEYLGYAAFEVDFGEGRSILDDAVKETTNMVAGTLRNILSKAGLECSLTPPKLHSSPQVPLINMRKAVQAVALHLVLPDTFIFAGFYRVTR